MFKKVLDHFMNRDEIRKIDTEFYPDPISSRGQDDFPSKMRGMLQNDMDECTGCGDCVQACPTQCIEIETAPSPRVNRLKVTRFDVDFSNCLFCGLCVDVCAPESLTHTKGIQPAVSDLKDLRVSFVKEGRLK